MKRKPQERGHASFGGPVRTEQYGYDELNRLTAVNYGDGETQSYTFDNMGNRLTKVDNGTESYTYNNANMLLTRGANTYTSDANGNTLTGGGRVSTWDSQNRLYACTFGGVTTTSTYAADGLRHRMVTGANTTDFVLDGTMAVQDVVNGAVAATYLTGPRGPEYRRDDVAGTVRWYVYDGLGSVVGEVAPDGTLTCTRKLDAYGCVRSSTGTATSKHKFVGSLGHPSDDETGLIYMRARHYDPVCGRFISEDPARNGTNWFVYCDGNPVAETDADGRVPRWVSWAFWGGGSLFAFAALGVMCAYRWNHSAYLDEAPAQLARLDLATKLGAAAAAMFGISAIGLVTDEGLNYVLAGIGQAGAMIALMCKGSEAGMYTVACTTVMASFAYGLMVLGVAESIGADS